MGLTRKPFQHLTDQPILDPDTPYWFIDGSSQKSPPSAAGYATIQGNLHHSHETQIIDASPLPPHTTSQQAELVALTRALTLTKHLRVNIYTDSKYAYNMLHSNILIQRERGFLTQKGSPIINSDLIHKLLEATLLQMTELPSSTSGDIKREVSYQPTTMPQTRRQRR